MQRAVMALLVAAAVSLAFAVPSTAKVTGIGQTKDEVIGFFAGTGSPASEDGTIKSLGGAISGGFFGNTSRSGADPDAPERGHGVSPSPSPGPLTGDCELVVAGPSIGWVLTENGPMAVPKGKIPNRCR